jgi:hypothetical protein
LQNALLEDRPVIEAQLPLPRDESVQRKVLALDNATRKRLIFEKANANAQRCERQKLLQVLSPEMRAILADASCVFTPDSDAVLSQFFPATVAGIGTPTRVIPIGYSFREFAWEAKVFASLPNAEVFRETPAHLMLRPPHCVSFQDQRIYVPQLPVFVVDFRAAARNIERLWLSAQRFLALVAIDMTVGIVIDSYIGYLPEDFNASEVVFEVASW